MWGLDKGSKVGEPCKGFKMGEPGKGSEMGEPGKGSEMFLVASIWIFLERIGEDGFNYRAMLSTREGIG